jgi:hypothetical protein
MSQKYCLTCHGSGEEHDGPEQQHYNQNQPILLTLNIHHFIQIRANIPHKKKEMKRTMAAWGTF